MEGHRPIPRPDEVNTRHAVSELRVADAQTSYAIDDYACSHVHCCETAVKAGRLQSPTEARPLSQRARVRYMTTLPWTNRVPART